MSASVVKPISAQRFDVYMGCTNKVPLARFLHTEIEHYSDCDEFILGVICYDHTDQDYGAMVLARDEAGRFRTFDVRTDFDTAASCRNWLHGEIRLHAIRGTRTVPQHEPEENLDLFKLVVSPEKQAPDFATVRTASNYFPARSVISSMMPFFHDVDGNFVEQFQTTGFDSRLWELYLFCMLSECGIRPESSVARPDYVIRGFPFDFSMEATIVARKPEDAKPIILGSRDRSGPKIESDAKRHDRMAIRFGSSLRSKISKEYWNLEEVRGRPFVIAIADFHSDYSMTWSHTSLIQYLFGYRHDAHFNSDGELSVTPIPIEKHKFEGKEIPSGFFVQPNTKTISAILSSSSGTISKFTRLGVQAGFADSDKHRVFRAGTCHDHDPNATKPRSFFYEVTTDCREDFCEGVSIYHNPNAEYPISPSSLPWFAHHSLEPDGSITSTLPNFFPYASMTTNITTKS